MADQLVAATVEYLLENAVSVAADKINAVREFRKDLEAMQEHAKAIQAVLADAETKQSRNPIVLSWLRKVEAAAFEAENVLDELLYESLRREVGSRDKAKKAAKVCLFFSLSKHDLSFRCRRSSKVREINGKFEKFKLEAPDIGLIRMEDSMGKADVVIAGRETNSLPLQFVAGREKEVSEIVGKLLSASTEASASVSVLSIVGMGGLGKTTLAKSVYNKIQIDNHFGQKIWVCVSDKFEVTELFRLILESLEGGKVEESSQDPIVRKIQEKLAGKRFLLVLDDVWNEEQTLWDTFFTSLDGLNTASGSCCLVTTRSQKTAKLVSTVDPYALDKLADDECWNILCRRATKDGEMPQQLNAYRDQILKRCQGLPLAANAVGGLLSLQRREEWVPIVEDKILKVSEYVEGEITPILRLSFDNLPSLSIKKCFAYCSIYPKDRIMKRMELIQLWMAEGFLQKAFLQEGVESRTVMEEIGEDHLTVLLQSSLLERARWGIDGYQMHDLVHDLAESVSEREQIDGEVRHLALASDDIEYNARSTLVRMVKGEISDKVLLKFQRLRVLNLRGMETENLPSTIGKAKHLRYLDLSRSGIRVLPDSLCKLYNLQTLKMPNNLQCLPPGFSSLISLRHLHFDPRDTKFKMAPNMGRLTCLQTLEFFNVGGEDGYEIKELGSMKNLAGCIEIRNLELVKGKEGARLANLFEKKKLVDLRLYWGSTDGNRNDEQVLEGLEPHPKLQGLFLRDYMGARLPQWLGQLKALTGLYFSNCKTLKDVPTLGHLPYLEELWIWDSDGVTCIGESFYVFPSMGGLPAQVFPSLKTMQMRNLPNLREWKGLEAANGPVFPKLETLLIWECCQLASVPSPFPSLKKLDIIGDNQVSVVRDIIGKSGSLAHVNIRSMGGLNSLAHVIDNHLTCLEHLEIGGCDNLMDISTIEFCESLVELDVSGCPKVMPCALNLQRIPSVSSLWLSSPNTFSTNVMPTGFRYLTNLRDLSIGPFTDDSIHSFDWSGLIACSPTLNDLIWDGSLQKHSCLPQQLQHLTSLQSLDLVSLNSVEALPDWLGNLTSLRELEVKDCPILRRLPSADSMRRLTNLRDLSISDCPLLTESSIQEISSTLPNLRIQRLDL